MTCRRLVLPRTYWLVFASVIALWMGVPDSAPAAPRILTVDRASASCSDARPRAAVTSAAPWCTLAPAATRTEPGDTVYVRAGTYTGFRPFRSGTPATPIRYVAVGSPVVLAPEAGAVNAVMLVRVSWIRLEGFTVSGGTARGVWVEDADHIDLVRLKVSDNPGAGVAVLRGQRVIVWRSEVTRNGGAGIIEYAGSSGNHFTRNTITGNGKNGYLYNGDGIQLAGNGTLVALNVITGNGDPGGREHGVYAGSRARGYVIEHNTIDGGPGAAIKAQGSGAVRYNRLGSGLFGLVLSDNPTPVSVVGNVIGGLFQHAVMVTSERTPGQARLWHNSVVQQGRSTTSGNAAALFVIAAGSLDIRNNLICYTAADNLGPALWVNSSSRVASLRSDANWLCSTDTKGRVAAWNGSLVTFTQWRERCGCATSSVASPPPTVDAGFHVTSPNLGIDLGQALGVAADFEGFPFDPTTPDAGAYQHR